MATSHAQTTAPHALLQHMLRDAGAARSSERSPTRDPPKNRRTPNPPTQVMLNFTVNQIRASTSGTILLITGDADFIRPAVWCKQQARGGRGRFTAA